MTRKGFGLEKLHDKMKNKSMLWNRLILKAPQGPRCYLPKEKYYSMPFEFNPYDDDDFPSVPHGDSLNHHYKIDLRNGDVYEGRGRKIGRLKKSEFERLKRDTKIRKIIARAQAYYREHHPEVTFDPIPWCPQQGATCSIRHKAIKAVYILKITVNANDG